MFRRIARSLRLLPALAATLACVNAGAADDLLDPDLAFRFSAKLIGPTAVEVRYRIADGYYLYRERFRISTGQDEVHLGKPQLPTGDVHEDEFFGKVETYRNSLTFRVPIDSAVPADGFMLKVVSQGCADSGVCYTPLTQTAKLVPAVLAEAAPPARKSSSLLSRLEGTPRSAGEAEEEFLPVEKAFTTEARSPDPLTVVVRLAPAESYYLYRDKIRITLDPGSGATIESVTLPRGETKQDPNFGKTEVFHQPVQAILKLKRTDANKLPAVLEVGFQGCSEKGLCYPPATRRLPVTLAALASEAPATGPPPTSIPNAGAGAPAAEMARAQESEDRQIAGLLKAGNFWIVMASFLGFGLLLSFTPCVLPMIPILSGMIAGQGSKCTRVRGVMLSATYVLGMAIAYAIAGVLAGLSGTLLSASLQNPWVLGAFAGVFILLALSMFGFYELQLPSKWQTGVADTSNRLSGGTIAGVFVMGALSAIIVGPCVAAPLAGALLYISQSRDVLLGGSALFAMALGMGVPLLVVGASAGVLLPKVGAWMQSVKNFFGVLLIGAAIWMVTPLIPVVAQMLCWSALLIVSGIFLRAIDPLPVDAGGYRRLWKAVGVIVLLAGVALLAGALSGSRNILQPLSGLGAAVRAGEPSGSARASFVRVSSIAELERTIAEAGKPVMLDFYADWCVSCKEMERLTFQDDRVKSMFAGMLLVQADVTANLPQDVELLKRFGLFGPPGIIFFDRRGNELQNARVIGFKPPEQFLTILGRVAGQS
ncbi:MAG TPA: protein-disulfide reductase DsbD [Burkholderiales bacterium]|nr:protein-disulfide reductase DsbD [Burkholderiales bacterium]